MPVILFSLSPSSTTTYRDWEPLAFRWGVVVVFSLHFFAPVARLRICKPVLPSVSWLSGTSSRVRTCDGIDQLYLTDIRLERFRNANFGIAISAVTVVCCGKEPFFFFFSKKKKKIGISHICEKPAVILAGYIQRGMGEIPSYEYLFT
ncbi:unnamed protein product [Tuber melanosporum]|uniref:(Perigord truffle) hypothetical protein n=1 Tax=Tuber melanosporum (strain Mel28) TaxID=656061 RepID=D5G9T0_TUBMM|nr:uncharacterized protein GSTUM_00005058001 [Tuber melanosporum]CAZ81273.1 unnamed protein product [Tuber melanosporum]